MSVASIANNDPLPHHDVESAVYVLLKVLTQTFKPPEDLRGKWRKTLAQYHWNSPDVEPDTLQQLRTGLWTNHNIKTSTIATTLRIFRLAGHVARAELVVSLLSLPLPTQLVASSGYEAVVVSLQDLVEQAVAAVESVDAGSLAREI